MTAPLPDPETFWLDRLNSAASAQMSLRVTNLEAQMTTGTVALAALAQKISNLEGTLMATAEEFATRLNGATDEIARDLQALRDQLQSVRDEIPAAQQAAVDDALAKLDAPIARLEALGQDPQNPVPDPGTGGSEPAPEPTPLPGGGEEVVNPTPNPDEPTA